MRAWLEKHPGEFLYDGESRVAAQLRDRRGPPQLDVLGLAERHPELITWLARMGALKLDRDMWAALQAKAIEVERIKPFIMPGKGTTALEIRRQE